MLEGTHVRIVGIDPTEDWYLVEVDGVEDQLWIYRALTRLVGSLDRVRRYTTEEIAQLPGADSVVPLAVTVPITMNVRTGPGLNYEVVRSVPKGTQGRIFGIDPNNEWFQIELEGLDTLVWVYQDLTTVVGSLAGVKWVTESEVALAAGRDYATAAPERPRGTGPDLRNTQDRCAGDVDADHRHRHAGRVVPGGTGRCGPAGVDLPRLHKGSRRLAIRVDADRAGGEPSASGAVGQLDHGRPVVAAGRRC